AAASANPDRPSRWRRQPALKSSASASTYYHMTVRPLPPTTTSSLTSPASSMTAYLTVIDRPFPPPSLPFSTS
ncbi:hypothetical protein ACLOJK_018729, partial [Asimina triloba]